MLRARQLRSETQSAHFPATVLGHNPEDDRARLATPAKAQAAVNYPT